MATCSRCGFAILGPTSSGRARQAALGRPPRAEPDVVRRCAKCGAALAGAPSPALRDAVRAVSDDVLGVTQAREEAVRSARRRRLFLWVGGVVGSLVLAAVLWYGLAWKASRDGIPLAEGTTWVFLDAQGRRLTLRIGGPGQIEGADGSVVACEVDDAPIGTGYVAARWRGVELVGVEGPIGRHLMQTRLIPFPYGPGSSWASNVGGSWVDAKWKVKFQAAPTREVLQVKAGTYEALRVDFAVSALAGPPVLTGSAWLADGVGPVRLQIDRGGYGVPEQALELAEFHPG